jgi:magnesium chelatase family protein
VQRYRHQISSSLLERIDLQVEVSAVPFKELTTSRLSESSTAMREHVMAARNIQRERFRATPATHCNAAMSLELVKEHCRLDESSRELLLKATTGLESGPRARLQIVKVARTIADLAGHSEINPQHLNEAIEYRALDHMDACQRVGRE